MSVIWWTVGVMGLCVGVLAYVVVTARMNAIASVPVDVNGRTLYIGQIGEALSNLGDLIDPNK